MKVAPWSLWAPLAWVVGCSGQIAAPPSAPAAESGTPGVPVRPGASEAPPAAGVIPGSAPTPTGGTSASDPGTLLAAAPTLRRLTAVQYQNSVRDLFGAPPPDPLGLEPDATVEGYAVIAAAQVSLSASATERYETAAYKVAHAAVAAPLRAGWVSCTPAAAVDDACARQALAKLGRRAWRRPLSTDELGRYVDVAHTAAQTLGDFWGGLEYGVAGLLQSPYFVYRVELGTPDTKRPERRVLTGYELASRLSYFLAATTPDDSLLDAAASGKLDGDAERSAQARRLLESAHGHEALRDFVTQMLHLDTLDDLPQLPSAFPLRTATLGAALREETLRGFEDLIFSTDGGYPDLFVSRRTFLNRELATLYALPPPAGTGFTAVTLPDNGPRAGLLGQGALLAGTSHATATSPTRRGRLVREVLLCQSIPPPPPNVDTSLPEDKATGPRTMRQKLAVHDSAPACAPCHKAMDPIGLGLEAFDALGAFRTMDAGQTLDTSGVLDEATFRDARGLGQALHDHPALAGCLVRHLYRYALGGREQDGQEGTLKALTTAFAGGGYKVRALMMALATSELFRSAGALP